MLAAQPEDASKQSLAVLFASAKGLSQTKVFLHHVLRAAVLPMTQGTVLMMTCFFILASGAMEIIHALLAPTNRQAAADTP